MGNLKGKSSFLVMTLSIVGLVLFVTMFAQILTALEAIRTYANIATFIALLIAVRIAPVVLLLGGTMLAGWGYWKGYSGSATQDPGGIIRIVYGVLVIILFVTLFLTLLTAFYTLYGADNASEYIAFQTVVTILPTVLFLGGVFAGGATAGSGVRTFRRRKSRRLS